MEWYKKQEVSHVSLFVLERIAGFAGFFIMKKNNRYECISFTGPLF